MNGNGPSLCGHCLSANPQFAIEEPPDGSGDLLCDCCGRAWVSPSAAGPGPEEWAPSQAAVAMLAQEREGGCCRECGEAAKLLACHWCGRSQLVISCQHYWHPRPISPDASGVLVCDGCWFSHASEMLAIMEGGTAW